ncbi:MAG: SRPBCC domain-containing protein [Cyclobacteriaceae bacterium]|nr:SRPBCC domain-containing protein [Cyclobacteriaceae bacterium]
MREIRTEIEIAAPLTKVWSILTDFDHWKDWNPIVNQAGGAASAGSKLNITMRGKDGKDANKYMPVITTFEKPKSFRWRAKMMAGFLFTNDKAFELEETAAGTRLIHTEAFSGMLVPLFWNKLEAGVSPMLKSMNNALKTLAEKNPD